MLIYILWNFIVYQEGLCQKWIIPESRMIYTLDGRAENITWDMDYLEKRLFNARWTLYDDIKHTEKVLVAVNANSNKWFLFQPNITTVDYMDFKSNHFRAKLILHHVDASSDHRIACSVSLHSPPEELKAFVHIRYASYSPIFEKPLPSIQHFIEGKQANMSVTLKGNPRPTIIWKFKKQNMSLFSRMKVHTAETVDAYNNTIITSTWYVTKLFDIDNGVLSVVGKYGHEHIRSPITTSEMVIDVQYAPRNLSFITNVSHHVEVKNNKYIRQNFMV